MKIIWDKNIETENKAEIEKYLTPFLWMVPAWAQRLNITLAESDEASSGNLAGMRMRFQYREIDIDICPEWFIRDDDRKRDAVIHELCHIFNYALFQFADDLIDKFVDDKAAEALKDELLKYLEGGTQDLAFAIQSKFDETAR
jgi:hypothetical protein